MTYTLRAHQRGAEQLNMEEFMEIIYKSTRSDAPGVSASRAILQGLADDGGLFVPTQLPVLDKTFAQLSKLDYQGVAYEVMKLFLTDYTEEELRHCIDSAYDAKFDVPEIAPLARPQEDSAAYLELFHGATIAFKDMALSILPHLMTTAAKKNNEAKEIVILTATSGDTGKAALAGFADVPGTKSIVFYPKDGVSSIQERQMVTQTGDNTCVIGIRGNFDDAQTGVKKIFTDPAVKEKLAQHGYQFSSANSINIGRLVPQNVYAYTRLLKEGRIADGGAVNFVVPTGNFGNILAAYYAKKLGVPVHKLICASNANKVLYDFFRTGTYDRNREFILTSSPSMDILISSNLERLLYYLTDGDCERVAGWMGQLATEGVYTLPADVMDRLRETFACGYATDAETSATIRDSWEAEHVLIDPHTAVGKCVLDRLEADGRQRVCLSTANPYKFSADVLAALGTDTAGMDGFACMDALQQLTGVVAPVQLSGLRTAPVLHPDVCDQAQMADFVEAACARVFS